MKKKYREIKVGGLLYGWTVKVYENGTQLNIWLNKQIIYKRLYSGDINHITPEMVRKFIKGKQEKNLVD